MSKAIVAIAKSIGQVEVIVDRLQNQAAVPLANISILVPDTSDVRDIGHVKTSKMPEGAVTGAVTGGLGGGVIGLLAGLGTLAIPGLGAFVAAGPIMAALSGAAAGATAGGVVGALIGLGIPEYEAKAYENKLKEGNYLIAVHHMEGNQAKEVFEILKQEDAEGISGMGESESK